MEAFNPREDESHGGTGKYPDELRERAIRVAVDARRDRPPGPALERISEQLGINAETLQNWVIQAEVARGAGPGPRPMTPPGWPSWSGRTVNCAGLTRS